MIGNATEVIESIDVLESRGPKDLVELTSALAAELLVMTGRADDFSHATTMITQKIECGAAMDKFREMVAAQSGHLNKPLLVASQHKVTARQSGVVCSIDTEALGMAIIEMGGGRRFVGQTIDHSVGLRIDVKLGDEIEKGDALATLFIDSEPAKHLDVVSRAIEIGASPASVPPLIVDRVVGV